MAVRVGFGLLEWRALVEALAVAEAVGVLADGVEAAEAVLVGTAVTATGWPTLAPAAEITCQVRVEAPATVSSQTKAIVKILRLAMRQ